MSRLGGAIRRNPFEAVGVAAFAVLALVLTLLVAGTLAGGAGEGRDFRAVFHDATGLSAGDDVRMAGVRVGKVEEVALHGREAMVRFSVAKDQPMYQGTVVSIDFLNLLGQRYLSLEAPHRGARLAAGATIPRSRTRDGLDLSALFNAFKPLFDLIKPADVNELAGNIVQALQGEGPTLRDLGAQTARLTRTLVDRDQVIGAVIDNVSAVMETMDDHRAQFESLVTELDRLTTTIVKNRSQIGATIDAVQLLVTRFSSLLHDGMADVTRDIASLASWAASFGRQAPRIARALEDTQELVKGYIRSLGLGSYLNTYVCASHLQLEDGPPINLSTSSRHSRRCS